MANQFYTLIVVPHAKARFRKFQVSVKLIKWTASIAAVVAVALTIGLLATTVAAVAAFTTVADIVDSSFTA